ncbi:hypothetical protein EMMF5_000585 [Cystobasidiomycetes sp. EMM_F5]
MDYLPSYPIIAGALVTGYLAYRVLSLGSRDKAYPPGPKTLPLLGNVHLIPQVPTEKHVYYDKVAKEFGDVFSLKLFNKTMVVINSAKATNDLMDKHRPDTFILDGHIAQGKHIVLTNGKKNATLRRLWNRVLAPSTIPQHQQLQNAEANATVFNLLANPSDFYEEIQRYPCSVATVLSYGKRAPTFRGIDKSGYSCKEFYRLDEDFLKLLEVGAVPMFDMVPILQVLPGPWNAVKVDANRLKRETDEFFWKQYTEVKRKMAAGIKTGCWLESIIENNSDNLAEDMQSWQAGIMLSGASSTAANTLLTTILISATHPRALEKAQAELDAVIGQDRLPTYEDIQSLPYCKAFIREIIRFRPTAPGGSPHLTTQDEIYNGYLIPKDSYIVGNTWGIMMDPEAFENPLDFWPERYVAHELGLKASAVANGAAEYWRNTFPFGAGRRICIGLHFAEVELFTVIPKVLHAFKYTPVGQLSFDWSAYLQRGTLAAPKPFECVIEARTPALAAAIKKEFEDVKPYLNNLNPDM